MPRGQYVRKAVAPIAKPLEGVNDISAKYEELSAVYKELSADHDALRKMYIDLLLLTYRGKQR